MQPSHHSQSYNGYMTTQAVVKNKQNHCYLCTHLKSAEELAGIYLTKDFSTLTFLDFSVLYDPMPSQDPYPYVFNNILMACWDKGCIYTFPKPLFFLNSLI